MISGGGAKVIGIEAPGVTMTPGSGGPNGALVQWLIRDNSSMPPTPAFSTGSGVVTDVILWTPDEMHVTCLFRDPAGGAGMAVYHLVGGDPHAFVRFPFDSPLGAHVTTAYTGSSPVRVAFGDPLWMQLGATDFGFSGNAVFAIVIQ